MSDENPGANTGNINISDISGGQIEVGAIVTGTVGGDVVGRDKIVKTVNNFIQQAASAVEEAEKARSIAAKRLAEGVRDYAKRLYDIAVDETDADVGGPYKGLLPYRLSDAELFFGRDRAIENLIRIINRGRLTVLHSESGAGKSSLLQAGIIPRLLADERPNLPIYLRPYSTSPSLVIKRTILPDIEKMPKLNSASLRELLRPVIGLVGANATLFLLIDQFEEYFTLLAKEKRAEFVRDLADCINDEALNVRWVLALRSEFFSDLANFRPEIENPFANEFRLNRLTQAEAKTIVTAPAERQGITVEADLVETLLQELQELRGEKEEISPPQIQLVCSALYNVLMERRNENPEHPLEITKKMYEEEGQAKGILQGHLRRVISRTLPSKEGQELARRLLVALVSKDVRRIRRSRSDLKKELLAAMVAAQNLDDLLEQLVKSRLLNVERDEESAETSYELAHDYLLTEIEVDPETQAQKAAQHMLDQEVEAYKQFKTLLSKDKFDIINSQRDVLVLDETAQELLQKSEDVFEQEFREKEVQRQRELEQAQQLQKEAEARQKAEAQRAQEAEAREREQAQSNKRLRRLSSWVVMILGFTVCSFGVLLLNLSDALGEDYSWGDFLAVDLVFLTILPGLIGAGLGWVAFRVWLFGRLGKEDKLSSDTPTVEQEATEQRPVKLRKRVDKNGWLEFASLPDTYSDKALKQHLETLAGAEVTLFVPEFVTEV